MLDKIPTCYRVDYSIPGDWDWYIVEWDEDLGKWVRSYKPFGDTSWVLPREDQSLLVLTEPAYRALLKRFSLEELKGEFPIEKIATMSLAELMAQKEKIQQ